MKVSSVPICVFPYVRMNKHGTPLDKDGNQLPTDKTADAHIPQDGFEVPEGLFDE